VLDVEWLWMGEKMKVVRLEKVEGVADESEWA
jgi:hypothetical protein